MTGRSDPLMLTDVHARRVRRDAYFTEAPVVAALLAAIAGGLVPAVPRLVEEPFAGANAIAAAFEDEGYAVHASDLEDYEGCPSWRPLKHAFRHRDFFEHPWWAPFVRPYAIVTNPPFDEDLAEAAIRLALAKRGAAAVWFLLKNEFDTSSAKRPDLFERPDFFGKIVMHARCRRSPERASLREKRPGPLLQKAGPCPAVRVVVGGGGGEANRFSRSTGGAS